jgi:hypothetical protein
MLRRSAMDDVVDVERQRRTRRAFELREIAPHVIALCPSRRASSSGEAMTFCASARQAASSRWPQRPRHQTSACARRATGQLLMRSLLTPILPFFSAFVFIKTPSARRSARPTSLLLTVRASTRLASTRRDSTQDPPQQCDLHAAIVPAGVTVGPWPASGNTGQPNRDASSA